VSLPFVTLIIVFVGIALRQILRIPLKIWQMMSVGALIVLLAGSISFASAFKAINWEVMAFLFGMFFLGQALEESGYLSVLVSRPFIEKMTRGKLVFWIVFGMGLSSAVLMNDTLAIIGTPVLLKIAKRKKMATLPLLLGLAYAITIGSVLSPIGNPQNFLISAQGFVPNPFLTFLIYLGLPTLISLALLYGLIYFLSRKKEEVILEETPNEPYNLRLFLFCKIALWLVLAMIGLNLISSLFHFSFSFPLYWIGLIPGGFLLLCGSKRREILKKMDWHTLLFFLALFILMQSVWDTSSLKTFPDRFGWMTSSTLGILASSVVGSQLISNVPLALLFLPTLKASSYTLSSLMALAAGSTLAGNFLIFGAASNFIIMQNAEKRGDRGLPFFTFALYGIPLTLVTFLVYWLYLR